MKKISQLSMDAYHLKLLAIFLMVIDHGYKVFLPVIVELFSSFLPMQTIFFVIYIGFGITRMGFPIFAYFIAEGCFYTKNKFNYLLRLLFFGVLSELPYQYFICTIEGTPFEVSFEHMNVFFTLFLGALAIIFYDHCMNKTKNSYLSLLPLIGCIGLAYMLHTDYDVFGVLLIFVFYYVRQNKHKFRFLTILMMLFSFVYFPIIDSISNGFSMNFIIVNFTDGLFMLLSIPVLKLYSGMRGNSMKYFFYLFYPVHLMLLVLLYNFCTS